MQERIPTRLETATFITRAICALGTIASIAAGQNIEEAVELSRNFPTSLGFVVAVANDFGIRPATTLAICSGVFAAATVSLHNSLNKR